VPEDRVPEDSVPEDSVPEDSVPEDRVPEDSVRKDRVPEDSVPEDSVPKGSVMEESTTIDPVADEWCAHHFDYLSPQFAQQLHPVLARMRDMCPVTYSDQYGGYWIVTRYDDVLRVAQDWETFSSELGVSPGSQMTVQAIPEHIDPPLHRVYKRLINAYFTPAAMAPYEEPTRALVTRLIDEFIEAGTCDFLTEFARPFPGLAFFDLVLGAPSDELAEINDLATRASVPISPDAAACWAGLTRWINDFIALRRSQPSRDDVVDAILHAEIEGRPVSEDEVRGLILLLILGGLETTAGALGHFMIRFCQEPEIPTLLRQQPELIPAAVEELLRLEGPFIAIGRTARHDAEISGHRIKQGDKVVIYWASANRDDDEFPNSASFVVDRRQNRHIAFGAGPHRCAGSNLARLNLRVAVHELVQRLDNIRLLASPETLPFHSALNRSPLSVPISFSKGARLNGVVDG
jgi:cytochrome P450